MVEGVEVREHAGGDLVDILWYLKGVREGGSRALRWIAGEELLDAVAGYSLCL